MQILLKENFKEHKNIKTILNDINNCLKNNGIHDYNFNENLIPKDGLYLFEQDGNLSKSLN